MSKIIEHVRSLLRQGHVPQAMIAQHMGVIPQRIHYLMTCKVPRSFTDLEAILELLDPDCLDKFRPDFKRERKEVAYNRIAATLRLLVSEIDNAEQPDAPTEADNVERNAILARMSNTQSQRGTAQERYEAAQNTQA